MPNNHHFERVIGIIGGAGVAAGAELVSRLEQKVTQAGAYRDAQHPQVVLFQATQVPSRSMYLENRGESFIPGYIDAALRLKNFGASFIVMCCNTAHYARQEIEDAAGIPVINLLRESLQAAHAATPAKTGVKVGIMCSDGTRKTGLFEKEADALGSGLDIIYPDITKQELVTQGICNIKKAFHRTKAETDPDRPQFLFAQAAQNLTEQGADVIVLACTEIPLDFIKNTNITVPVIDTIDVLADCCLQRYNGALA